VRPACNYQFDGGFRFMLSIELDPNQHIKKKKKMGTGRALVWYSPKSYPNQTHIRELKEKNNNNKKTLHNAIYFYRFSFYLKVGF
jgi:hypothetical protein